MRRGLLGDRGQRSQLAACTETASRAASVCRSMWAPHVFGVAFTSSPESTSDIRAASGGAAAAPGHVSANRRAAADRCADRLQRGEGPEVPPWDTTPNAPLSDGVLGHMTPTITPRFRAQHLRGTPPGMLENHHEAEGRTPGGGGAEIPVMIPRDLFLKGLRSSTISISGSSRQNIAAAH